MATDVADTAVKILAGGTIYAFGGRFFIRA